MGFVGPGLNSINIIKKSLNGSVILKNNIIILAKEDLQDYLNDSLIFYDIESSILKEI